MIINFPNGITKSPGNYVIGGAEQPNGLRFTTKIAGADTKIAVYNG